VNEWGKKIDKIALLHRHPSTNEKAKCTGNKQKKWKEQAKLKRKQKPWRKINKFNL
jgi:hypothetical protein